MMASVVLDTISVVEHTLFIHQARRDVVVFLKMTATSNPANLSVTCRAFQPSILIMVPSSDKELPKSGILSAQHRRIGSVK